MMTQHQQENPAGLAAGHPGARARAGVNSERAKAPEPDSLEYDGPSAPDFACLRLVLNRRAFDRQTQLGRSGDV